MQVELDIFSGRPNPRWQLDDSTSRRLEVLHRSLRPIDDRPDEPPGLGYRGFVYGLDGDTWRARLGRIVGSAAVLTDPIRSVERLLLDELPAEFGDLRPIIAAELDRGA